MKPVIRFETLANKFVPTSYKVLSKSKIHVFIVSFDIVIIPIIASFFEQWHPMVILIIYFQTDFLVLFICTTRIRY